MTTHQEDLLATRAALKKFADGCDDRMMAGHANKIADYCMLLAHTGEPETARLTEVDIAQEHAKLRSRAQEVRDARSQMGSNRE